MNRMFQDHVKREGFSLDGTWQFIKDTQHIGEAEKWYQHFPKTGTMQVAVPSCINNRLGFAEFQDVCWYQKTFFTRKGIMRIHFGAVSEYARVYLDGMYLGDHYGGFTAFEFTAEVEKGQHTLTVMVDAASSPDTIPLYEVDWHHYCGIIRSVEVFYLPMVSIQGCKVDYSLSENMDSAQVQFKVALENRGSAARVPLKIWLNDSIVAQEEAEVNGETSVCLNCQIDEVKLWNIGDANLYTVRIETDNDDLVDRIGFRRIEVSGKQILLNGKPIKIKGVNRHEEHPDWGFAVPLSIMQRDMDILKNLNVNMVRGSHYPNSKDFLDMCDEEGILFWSEIPMWGFPEESVQRPLVMERGLKMHQEMLEQYYHHPSIIIWGLHNEIATETEGGREITKSFIQKIRSMDQSRLITYATNRILKDECLDLVDIISVNQYVGWYEGDICDWADFMTRMKAYLKEKGVAHKPVLMSEFGVGAMFGHKNFEELRWSENYQEQFYMHTIPLFLGDPDICGVLLWQFCDIRSNAKWSLLRARSFNNKGLINEYRNPKLAYYKVKEMFSHEWNS